jgi:hypothetical protein
MLPKFGDACQAAGGLPAALEAWQQSQQIRGDLGWPESRRIRASMAWLAARLLWHEGASLVSCAGVCGCQVRGAVQQWLAA